jgi:hypothetical protein
MLLNLFALSVNAQHKKYNHKTIRLATCVLVNDFSTKNYSISIYENGLKLDSIFIDDVEAIDVIFKLHKIYTIEIVKAGFESRVIVVNTNLPNEVEKLNKKVQQFCIHLSKKVYNLSSINARGRNHC